MSDEHLPKPERGTKLAQLDFFEILDPNAKAYSQAIELYDLIPKYVRYGRKRELANENVDITRQFMVKGTNYELTISGAIIKKFDKDDKDAPPEVHVFYPGTREELVEDALRKITVSEGRTGFDDDGAFSYFTTYELQTELKSMGHYYSNTEIKEALAILHKTGIAVESNGKRVTSGYLLPHLQMASEDDLRLDRDTKCVVRFHEIVSHSIKQMEFRQFNYAMSMSFSRSLTRSLFKRLSQRFRQASSEFDYTLSMITLLRDAGEALDTKMHNNIRKARKAFEELVDKGVIRCYREDVVKVGRRIADVKFTVETIGASYVDQPNRSFNADQKRANALQRDAVVALEDRRR